MDILKMSKNDYYKIIFFHVTEKIFLQNPKSCQSILGKKVNKHKKVNFQKNPKKVRKSGFLSKKGETSLRRLKTPT
jgi:hypothetical protein